MIAEDRPKGRATRFRLSPHCRPQGINNSLSSFLKAYLKSNISDWKMCLKLLCLSMEVPGSLMIEPKSCMPTMAQMKNSIPISMQTYGRAWKGGEIFSLHFKKDGFLLTNIYNVNTKNLNHKETVLTQCLGSLTVLPQFPILYDVIIVQFLSY